MSKYRPIILRVMAIFVVVMIVGISIMDYIEKGRFDFTITEIVKIVGTIIAAGMMFFKSFFLSGGSDKRDIVEAITIQVIDSAFSEKDKTSKKFFLKGERALREEDFDSAQYNFEKAIKKSSTPKAAALSYAWLGRVNIRRRHFDEAIKSLEKATSLDKFCEDGWFYLSDAFYQIGDFKKGISVAEEGLVFCGESHFLNERAGFGWLQLKEYERAVKYCLAAKKIRPDYPLYVKQLLYCCAQLGDEKLSNELLFELKSLSPADYQKYKPAIENLLEKARRSKIQYTGNFVLELGGIDEIEDCTFEDLVLALNRMWNYDYEFIILTPPAPINSVLFIQMYVTDKNTALVEMSVGENGKGKLYNKKCSKQETETIFYNFFNERKTPNIIGFKETQLK